MSVSVSLRSLVLVVAVMLLIACGHPRATVISKGLEATPFATLPGKIGIVLKSTQGRFAVLLDRGAVSRVEQLPSAPVSATSRVEPRSAEPPSHWPQLPYYGPYLISPDGRHVAACTRGPTTALGPQPGSFVIFDAASGKLLANVQLGPEQYVESLAWVDGTKVVAVLEGLVYRRSNLASALVSVFGFRMFYKNYDVSLYDVTGNRRGTARIAENLANASGEIVWTQ